MKLFRLFALFSFSLLFSRSALAQSKPVPAGQGPERLEPDVKDWDRNRDEVHRFQDMHAGRESPTNAENSAILDHAAQWYTYRMTWSSYQDPERPGRLMGLQRDIFEQFFELHDPKRPPTLQQIAFMDELRKHLVQRLHDVVKNPKLIARVNACMLLARIAATGFEETADVFSELILDPAEHEAVKFWAFRGLKDLFAMGRGENANPFRNHEREARAVQALIDYLAQKPKIAPGTPAEELEALAYVRTEAIAALGETRFPAETRTVNKQHILERPTALTLLRYVSGDQVAPPPALDEQVAAFIGICQLRSHLCQDYQLDYTIQHLARFIIDLVQRFNAYSVPQGDKDKPGKQYPWRLQAMRLCQALDALKADATSPPVNEHSLYVSKFADLAGRLLREIMDGKSSQPSAGELAGWLAQTPPKAKSVYKSLPASVVADRPIQE
jgi:hypothetical protein